MRLGVERFLKEDPTPKTINPVQPEPKPEPDRKDLPSDTQEDQPVRPEPKTATKPELKPIEGVALPFDPQRDRARGLMAGLCDWVRQYGIGVYEVHYKDKLFIYWVVGEQEVKVYEVEYKQKTLDELEKEVRRILGLVMRADRLMKEGYDVSTPHGGLATTSSAFCHTSILKFQLHTVD